MTLIPLQPLLLSPSQSLNIRISMASPSPPHSVNLFLLLLILLSASLSCAATPIPFRVGGPLGWRKPTGHESETYNHWAGRNRFHIGDSLYFKYENDSVLVVDRDQYGRCNTTEPLMWFTGGNTTFRFDRFGYFYFISGQPGHCQAGQKLIVRVMVHPEMASAAPAAAPAGLPGHGSGSPDQTGSSGSWRIRISAVSVLAVMALAADLFLN